VAADSTLLLAQGTLPNPSADRRGRDFPTPQLGNLGMARLLGFGTLQRVNKAGIDDETRWELSALAIVVRLGSLMALFDDLKVLRLALPSRVLGLPY
jgi:hypothetical protein